jgi:hypothetical protein
MAGDVNSDNRVGLVDLALVGANLGTASGAARSDGDQNGDGAVNRVDAAIVVRNLGRFYDPPTPAPAPVTAAVESAHEATATSPQWLDAPRRSARPTPVIARRSAGGADARVPQLRTVIEEFAPQVASRVHRQLRASGRGQRSARYAVLANLDD